MARICYFLLFALLACESTTEESVATFDNDFIAGQIGDRSFRLVRQTGESLFPYYQTYNVDSVSAERAPDLYYLVLQRSNVQVSELIQLSIPLDPLYEAPYPIHSLTGQLSFADLLEDSTLGCPHIDSSSWATVPVSITVDNWANDELTGTFSSLSEQAPGEGEFSFVVRK